MCRQISTHHSQGAWSVRITLPRAVQCGLTPQHAGKARWCHHEVTFVMSEAQNAFEGVYEGGMPVLRTLLCWVRPIWKIVNLISSWAEVCFSWIQSQQPYYFWTDLNIFPHLGRPTVCQKKVQLHIVVFLWGQGIVHHLPLPSPCLDHTAQ